MTRYLSVLTIFLLLTASAVLAQDIQRSHALRTLRQIHTTILQEYYQPVNPAALLVGAQKNLKGYKGASNASAVGNWDDFAVFFSRLCEQNPEKMNEMGERAVAGMVEALGDPYSIFLNRTQWAYARQVSSGGDFAGVGVELSSKDGRLVIASPIEGSPAEKAGVLPGDIVWAVAGKQVEGRSLQDVLDSFDGPVGSALELTVVRGGGRKHFSIKRAALRFPPPRCVILTSTPRAAYLRISYFGSDTAAQVRNLLDKARGNGIEHLVLDLRNNPGGDLQAAVDIASMFAGKKPVVMVRKKAMKVPAPVYGSSAPLYRFRTAVLINEGSASAAEVLASALAEQYGAALVGTKSFGKALIQSVYALPGDCGLKLTTSSYYTSKGKDILYRGLAPEVTVPTAYPLPQVSKDPVVLKALTLFSGAGGR